MTGEMSRDEVTEDAFPLHFALAAKYQGATVEPFDQYQGPFVSVPGHGRIWLSSDDGYFSRWYSEKRHQASWPFIPDGRTFQISAATELGCDLINNGGFAIDDNGNVLDGEDGQA